MTTIHTQVMKRIERIQLLRKLFFKTLILGAFVIIAHHFISIIHVGKNALYAMRTFNIEVIGGFLFSMFTHTEFATHIVMATITYLCFWIIKDINTNTSSLRFKELSDTL